MLDVGIEDVDLFVSTRRFGLKPLVSLGERPDLNKSRVAADRPRLFADDLQPVVIRRVVAGRHHDPAVGS